MDKDRIKDFTFRIAQASKTELIVIMYDMILEDVKSARKAFDGKNYAEYEHELKHATKIINELMAVLDYAISLSKELFNLYSYANRLLIKSYMGKTTDPLVDVEYTISKLREAFSTISREDASGPVMENVQQVYAGLTYGKGTLNESFLEPSQKNRGYKA